jgi:hypothetical protein
MPPYGGSRYEAQMGKIQTMMQTSERTAVTAEATGELMRTTFECRQVRRKGGDVVDVHFNVEVTIALRRWFMVRASYERCLRTRVAAPATRLHGISTPSRW